jgi:preprotein translocase subunit SecE
MDDPESKKLLKDTFELARENNRMLRKVRGVQKRQALWSIMKIIVIAAIALGAFYYLEPYMEKAMNVFNQISGMKQSLDNSSFGNIFKK